MSGLDGPESGLEQLRGVEDVQGVEARQLLGLEAFQGCLVGGEVARGQKRTSAPAGSREAATTAPPRGG